MGAPWLKPALVQCVWAATRTKASYLQAQFLRLHAAWPKEGDLRRCGLILTAAYHMLKDGTQDLVAAHFDRRAPAAQARPPGQTPARTRLLSRTPPD